MASEIYGSLGVVGEVEGVAIHATSDGKFAAVVGDAVIKLANKKALEKRIAGVNAPVAAMYARYAVNPPERRTVVGITRGKYDIRVRWLAPMRYGDSQETTERADDWYLFDEEMFDALTENAAALKRLYDIRADLLKRCTRITARSWAEAQTEAQAVKAEQES